MERKKSRDAERPAARKLLAPLLLDARTPGEDGERNEKKPQTLDLPASVKIEVREAGTWKESVEDRYADMTNERIETKIRSAVLEIFEADKLRMKMKNRSWAGGMIAFAAFALGILELAPQPSQLVQAALGAGTLFTLLGPWFWHERRFRMDKHRILDSVSSANTEYAKRNGLFSKGGVADTTLVADYDLDATGIPAMKFYAPMHGTPDEKRVVGILRADPSA